LQQYGISKEQIKTLKDNPDLLRQAGYDPSILDLIDQPQSKSGDKATTSSNDLIKSTVKSQFQKMVEPYVKYIPITVAALLFLTLQSLQALLSIILGPLLWFTFWVFAKTGFIKFQIETREVKKMVI
jgi:hypothetical protein